MRRKVLLAVLVATAVAGCRGGEGPAETYRRFAAAARAGDADAAWRLLSKPSRAALDARARELAARAPGVLPATGRDLLLGDQSARAPRLRTAVVVRESSDAAVLRVEDEAGGKGDVTLVREGGAWRVALDRAAE